MGRFIDRFNLRSEFSKNFLALFTGTSVAQVIPILISPLLSRIYTEEGIGTYSLYYTIAGILSILSTGRYYSAMVLPKSDVRAFALFKLCIYLSLGFLFFFSILILAGGNYIVQLMGVSQYTSKWSLFYIILVMFSYNIYITYDGWLNREKRYKLMASNKVTQTSIYSGFQLIFSFIGWSALILGRFIGQLGSVVILYLKAKEIKKLLTAPVKKKYIALVAKKYKDFPLYSMPTGILNHMSFTLPILLYGNLYGTKILGLFSWASMIILVPMGMITTALSQVFYQKISHIHNEGKSIYPTVKKTYFNLLKFSLITFPIAGIFAPWIFKFVFGPQWEDAGVFTQCLIPSLIVIFANNPISLVIFVKNKQKVLMYYEIVLFILRLSGIMIGFYLFDSALMSTLFFSLCGLASGIYMSFYLFKISK